MTKQLPPTDSSPRSPDNVVTAARKKFSAGPRPPGRAVALDSDAGARHIFGAFGVHWKIDSADSDRRFSVVHHPIAPRSLVAPLHRHHREDEYSYVLTGKLGALLGEEVVTAGPGTWVFKPREQWHTFWNAGDTPCEIIEVISPGGFEDFFREWEERLGPEIARAAHPHRIDGDTLIVRVATSAWLNELSLRQGELLRRLNAGRSRSRIQRLVFRLDPEAKG